MKPSWDRGRAGRIAIAVALAGLLVPNLVSQQPQVARAATYSVSEFDVSTRSTAEIRSRVDGRMVVWQDYRNNSAAATDETANADVFYINLDNGNDNKANEGDANAKRPAISGDVIVWAEMTTGRGLDIEAYNFKKNNHFNVDNDNSDADFPAISGDTVVYQTNRKGNWDIRGHHISSDKHFDNETNSSDQTQPAIDGNLVAWVDTRDGSGKTDIFAQDTNSGDTFRVTDTHDAHDPAVSGNYIAYATGTDNGKIYLYNRTDGSKRQISSTTQKARGTPRISGNVVVWMDERKGTGKKDIWGYDLSTDTEFPVVEGGDDQYDPDVSGTTIVWTDESHNQDIRGGDLSISGAATPTPSVAATPTPGPTSAPLPTVTPGARAPRDARFFVETGFRIDNDTIWDYFSHRGRVNTFGFPVSRTFRFQGFTTQFFQRHVVQIGPDGNARLLNLLDPGLMPVDRINNSTFPAFDPAVANAAPQPGTPGYDTGIIDFVRAHAPETFNGQPTRFWTTFNNIVTCEDAFPPGACQPNFLPGFDLELAGIPTSNPKPDPANGNFIYLRFQRGIAHYDANCQCTRGILLADNFKNVITGQNLPADLDSEMSGTKFYKQYNNGQPLGLNRPGDLRDTDMTNAFEPQ